MNRRVVVHAGFHKTGTTSAQRFLFKNGKVLWPKTAMIFPFKLRDTASTQALRYSKDPSKDQLAAFAADMHAVLTGLDLTPNRPVIISDENLLGQIPGRNGAVGYDHAPALLDCLSEVVHDVLGDGTDLRFVLTTRDRDSWLRSLWMHNLRRWRLTLDFDEFVAGLGPMSDHATVAQTLTDQLTDPVVTARLEDMSDHPEGPAKAVLDQMNLPQTLRDKLLPTGVALRGPHPALAVQFLALNRSDLSDKDLQARKNEMAKQN